MKFIPTGVSQTVGRTALKLDISSPKLLFGAGVVSMVGSTVLACRATLKLEEVLQDTQDQFHTAQATRNLHEDRYTEGDLRKDKAIILTRGTVSVLKLYGPAIVVGSVGVACLTKSHNILQERNTALMAAYTAVDKAFNQYRARVIEKYGADEDDHLRYGSERVEIVNEKGKTELVTRVNSGEMPSMYARFFDQLSTSWSKEPEYNLVFLRCQQNYANDLLKSRGHVFLNEVYDMLGIERTKAGQVVGWVVSDGGDNYVDFGIYDGNEKARDFVNGREGAILLDFNVDGIIYDKIESQDVVGWQS
jgi:hypothetical protein